MGLITEEVEIMINSSNVEYWENKGYDIPRYYNTTYKKWCFKNGTKIHVRTSDLPKYSKAMVLVKYDCCGIEKIIRYEQYAQRNRDGKMYCSHCFSTLLLSGENNPKWRQDYSDDDRIERRYINGYYDFIKKINVDDSISKIDGNYEGEKILKIYNQRIVKTDKAFYEVAEYYKDGVLSTTTLKMDLLSKYYEEVLTLTYEYVILKDYTIIPINDTLVNNHGKEYSPTFYLKKFESDLDVFEE